MTLDLNFDLELNWETFRLIQTYNSDLQRQKTTFRAKII